MEQGPTLSQLPWNQHQFGTAAKQNSANVTLKALIHTLVQFIHMYVELTFKRQHQARLSHRFGGGHRKLSFTGMCDRLCQSDTVQAVPTTMHSRLDLGLKQTARQPLTVCVF